MTERLPSRSGAAIPREPKHGTLAEYNNHGCRCEACKAAQSEYTREYRARKREGRPAPPRKPYTPRAPREPRVQLTDLERTLIEIDRAVSAYWQARPRGGAQ